MKLNVYSNECNSLLVESIYLLIILKQNGLTIIITTTTTANTWSSKLSINQSIIQSPTTNTANAFVIAEKSCFSTNCLWCFDVIFLDGFFLFQILMIYHIIVKWSVHAQFFKSYCEIIFCYTIVWVSLQNEKERSPSQKPTPDFNRAVFLMYAMSHRCQNMAM